METILRELTTEKNVIGNALLFSFDHAESSAEIVLTIAHSLKLLETPFEKKVF